MQNVVVMRKYQCFYGEITCTHCGSLMNNSPKDIFRDPNIEKRKHFLGRRSGLDRRYFSYDIHLPEKRSGLDKRHVLERRVAKDRRIEPDRRAVIKQWNYDGPERRVLKFRRSDAARRA